jgi:ABC-type multidrug transport system fused ATPase/permease subunit
MRDVELRYEGNPNPAVTKISFTCRAGESVALVGATGAGKSTLADLILSVLDPDSGEVLVGGITPRDAIKKWPGAISYVPQNVALTVGTVRENVAMGIPRDLIDDDLVRDALRRAHLADFLTEFREGIDTNVGERGFMLSGGQRQRLGIARALYTKPKLLVLDEATSALDSETEQAIIEMLNELESEVTTVTVAHRLATVRRADLLIYLRDGHSIAQGTFAQVRELAPDFDRQALLLGL